MTPELDIGLTASVEGCPLIYQEIVNSCGDVRVICFGEYQIACRISKRDGADDESIDIRELMILKKSDFSNIEIPNDLKPKLKNYMKELGLIYGAFDFVIDTDNKWWFLECNESGQFLFVEYFLPETRLLDKFCRFVKSLSQSDNENEDKQYEISIKSFEADGGLKMIEDDRAAHKTPKSQVVQIRRS